MVGVLLALWFILAQAPGQRLVGVYEGTLPCAAVRAFEQRSPFIPSLAEPRTAPSRSRKRLESPEGTRC